jgi:hypothetical protein
MSKEGLQQMNKAGVIIMVGFIVALLNSCTIDWGSRVGRGYWFNFYSERRIYTYWREINVYNSMNFHHNQVFLTIVQDREVKDKYDLWVGIFIKNPIDVDNQQLLIKDLTLLLNDNIIIKMDYHSMMLPFGFYHSMPNLTEFGARAESGIAYGGRPGVWFRSKEHNGLVLTFNINQEDYRNYPNEFNAMLTMTYSYDNGQTWYTIENNFEVTKTRRDSRLTALLMRF